MGISKAAQGTIRRTLITATLILVPFAIYYVGFRSQQLKYHEALYARQIDLVARQFRASVLSIEKFVFFDRQTAVDEHNETEREDSTNDASDPQERCPMDALACRHGKPFERLTIDPPNSKASVGEIGKRVGELRVCDGNLIASYSIDSGVIGTATIPLQDIAFGSGLQHGFDALLLANADGTVFAQSEGTLPQITRVDPSLVRIAVRSTSGSVGGLPGSKKQGDEPTVLAGLLGSGPEQTIRVGGVEYRVFSQAVALPLFVYSEETTRKDEKRGNDACVKAPPTWIFVGLLPENSFTAEMGPPLPFLAMALLVVILALLAWPFVRLQLMGRNESIQKPDLVFVLAAALLGTACVSAAALDYVERRAIDDRIDRSLIRIAADLRGGFDAELRQSLSLMHEMSRQRTLGAGESEIAKCELDQGTRSDIVCFPGGVNSTAPPFGTILWLNRLGEQVGSQWTYRISPAQRRLRLRDRQYFQRIRDSDSWNTQLAVTPSTRSGRFASAVVPMRFFVERIVSWKEGTKETAVSLDLRSTGSMADRDTPIVAVMLRHFETFRRSVFAQGMGFAVFDRSGTVLFHSNDALSLAENFLEEIYPRLKLDAAIAAGIEETLQAKYHGDSHRFHVSPLSFVPWTLVVFSDSRFLESAHFDATITMASSLIAVTLVILALLVVSQLAKRELELRWMWSQPEHHLTYWLLATLFALLSIAVFTLSVRPIPPSAPPPGGQWLVAMVVALLVLSGWTVGWASMGGSPSSQVDDRKQRTIRGAISLLPLCLAAGILLATPAPVWEWGAALGLSLTAAALLALVLVSRAPSAQEGMPPGTSKLRVAHLAMLFSGLVLTATGPAQFLRSDSNRLQMDRLTRANSFYVADAIEQRAQALIQDGERYCRTLEAEVAPGAMDPRQQSKGIRACSSFAAGLGAQPIPPRQVKLRGYDASEILLEFRSSESDRPELVWAKHVRNIAASAFHPYLATHDAEAASSADDSIAFTPTLRRDIPPDTIEAETRRIQREYVSGFLSTLVPPYDEVSTRMRGFLRTASSSGAWRFETARPAEEAAPKRADGSLSGTRDPKSVLAITHCPDAGLCLRIERRLHSEWLPRNPMDRALLSILAGITSFVALWLLAYARRHLVGNWSPTPDPRLTKTWLVSGADCVAEPTLRAALRDSSAHVVEFPAGTSRSEALETLRRRDRHHAVLVVRRFDHWLLHDAEVRDALHEYLKLRLERPAETFARDVVLVSEIGGDELIQKIDASSPRGTGRGWGDLLGRCIELTRRSHLQVWLGSGSDGSQVVASLWLDLIAQRGAGVQWLDDVKLDQLPVAVFSQQETFAYPALDVLFADPGKSSLRLKLLGILEALVKENLDRVSPARPLHLILLTSAISVENLLRRVPTTSAERARWSALFASGSEVWNLDTSRRLAAGDAKTAAEQIELEFAWDPILASRLRGSVQPTDRGLSRDRGEVAEAMATRSDAYFQSIWRCCTNDEKLALYHLAEGQMLNPRNRDVIDSLLRRRLVRKAPQLRIALPSFSTFVRRISHAEDVEVWRGQEPSTWQHLRTPLAVVLFTGSAFLVMAGGESTIALVSGLAAGVPAIVQMVGRLLPVRSGGA